MAHCLGTRKALQTRNAVMLYGSQQRGTCKCTLLASRYNAHYPTVHCARMRSSMAIELHHSTPH
eukprot:22293-Eustigmatos_ZCMA.PRE.1